MIAGIQSVSKRVVATMPDALVADLEQWAKEESRPVGSLAAFLLEQAIRDRYPEKYGTSPKKGK